ncbi:sushi, von Willebrand factor type A, EGF and pentraxin domain-containing protein 1-like isoform X1 [Sycon ciliatum]|uniref:sushi, von Willebrand factor type A, EGF and pentraxin domain-containing protein 1-like isoform X1 n=1 Tax=Sycon ciliatum TaxID=27933 RepID=UPI0031F66189
MPMAWRAAVILLAFLALTDGACLAPELPVSGNYHIEGHGKVVSKLPYQQGNVLTLVCNAGFTGSIIAVCQSDDTWSSLSANCQRISCPRPSHLANGGYSHTGLRYQDTVVYHCNEGYFIVGHPRGFLTVRCLANGTWSPPKPTCQRISCPRPSHLANGAYSYTGLRYQDTVAYHCNEGYFMVGHPRGFLTVRCLANGTWSPPKPTCQPRAHTPASGCSNSTEASLSVHTSILLGLVSGIVIMAVPLLWVCRQWRKTVRKQHCEGSQTEQQVVQMPTLTDNEAYGSANRSNAEEDTGYECVA